jgi:hypothetical protein
VVDTHQPVAVPNANFSREDEAHEGTPPNAKKELACTHFANPSRKDDDLDMQSHGCCSYAYPAS